MVTEKEEVIINDIEKLLHLKYECQYESIIQGIAGKKFHLLFWSTEQFFLWEKFVIKEKCPLIFTVIKNIVHNIQIQNCDEIYKITDLLLLTFSTRKSNALIPLAQAITEKFNFTFLITYIQSCMKVLVKQPECIITQYNIITLNAISVGFNSCCLNDYISKCFKWIYSKELKSFKSFIFIDIMSLLTYIDSLDCFKVNQKD